MVGIPMPRNEFQVRGRRNTTSPSPRKFDLGNPRAAHTAWCAVSILVLMTPLYSGPARQIKPGWNIFSPDQDIEMGKRLSATAESQLPMLEDLRINGYLNRLGRKITQLRRAQDILTNFIV